MKIKEIEIQLSDTSRVVFARNHNDEWVLYSVHGDEEPKLSDLKEAIEMIEKMEGK